jgi:hypothetical protein
METFMAACTGILIFLVIWRIVRPFHCQCGYTTVFARAMMKHLSAKHGYKEIERS